MGNNDSHEGVDRRSILRGVGAVGGVVASGGVASAAPSDERGSLEMPDASAAELKAAIGRRRAVAAEFRRPERVRGYLREEAGDLMEAIADEGFLDHADPDRLTLSRELDTTKLRPDAGEEGFAVVPTAEDGEPSPFVMLSHNTDDARLGIYLQPARDDYHAFVEPTGDDRTHAFFSTDGGDVRYATGSGDCDTSTTCQSGLDYICHLDESEYCTKVYYEEWVIQCCPTMGCGKIGTEPCLDGCVNKEGPLCCCV